MEGPHGARMIHTGPDTRLEGDLGDQGEERALDMCFIFHYCKSYSCVVHIFVMIIFTG